MKGNDTLKEYGRPDGGAAGTACGLQRALGTRLPPEVPARRRRPLCQGIVQLGQTLPRRQRRDSLVGSGTPYRAGILGHPKKKKSLLRDPHNPDRSRRPHLTLLPPATETSPEPMGGPAFGERRPEQPRLAPERRRREILRPWPVVPDDGVRAVASEARAARLPLDLALALVIERELVAEDLGDVSSTIVAAVDAGAQRAQVAISLGSASAAYLRLLLRGDTRRQAPSRVREPLVVTLPARLSDRLKGRRLTEGMRHGALNLAVSWEIAAVAEGRTMAEWAYRSALTADLRS